MDRQELLARLDEERRNLQPDGAVIERLPLVTRLRSMDDSHHSVIFSRLTSDTVDDVIAGEVEHYRGLGVGFEWKVFSHDAPGDLLARLRAKGFEVGEKEAVLVYDLASPARWLEEAEGYCVRRVDCVEDVARFRAAAEAIFKKDYAFTANELAAALRSGSTGHRGYLGLAGEDVVSIGRLYTHPQSAFAGLYGGGTVAPYRGRGFYRAVVAARARDAMALGARYLMVDALPTSRPILERLGFEHLADTWPCEWRGEEEVR